MLEVTDINDNAPVFSGDYNVGDHDRVVFEHYMPESAQVGSTFSIPPAYDPDSGRRGRLSYDLLDTADAKAFELRTRETRDGAADLRLVLLVELDRYNVNNILLIIKLILFTSYLDNNNDANNLFR